MYLKKLDLSKLFFNQEYDGLATYANVKRAQVTLAEEMSKQEKWQNFHIFSMHPGWVATEGLKFSLPSFHNIMKNRLRNLEGGSDTIIWLLLTGSNIKTGGFYFDRKITSPYLLKNFNPSKSDRRSLLEKIESYMSEFVEINKHENQ